jgi:hypothetical protein
LRLQRKHMRAQNLCNGMICKNILHFLEELKNMENRVAWFLAELCKTNETSSGLSLLGGV